jgi:acetyl-CoA carboxylase carboxyl transferase subunit beta
MGWFTRRKEGITTSTDKKKETPDGLWSKCPKCNNIVTTKEYKQNLFCCIICNYHSRIGSTEYFEILFDKNKFTELDADMVSEDPLNFKDTKQYTDRIKNMQETTGLKDAVRTAHGKLKGEEIVIAAMDFSFIGGSMGSVVGEKIARAIDYARINKHPMIIISKSGGARMMEAALSLMQLVKTSSKLAQLSKAGLPYISLCTDPTFGGATASFSMLGDMNIAEPNALIGFAGPRVVKETIGKDLPKDFQTAEFLKEQGFIDFIVHRKDLKNKLAQLFRIIKK